MRLSLSFLSAFLSLGFFASASTIPRVNSTIEARADSSKVGYFFVHFYDRQPAIFAHLSNGNDALSYRALNGDNAILVPTGGTKAARDPYLVSAPDDSRHWIIATDLDIAAINNDWGLAVTKGSKSLHVWESTDLVNWGSYRLVKVSPDTAGMTWAPEAIWDSSRGAYLVHWASRLYAANDPNHTGTATRDQILYAYTNDFRTFTTPQTYIAANWPVIDLTFLPLGGTSYARFVKDENVLKIYEERSNNGLTGTWTRVGGSSSYVTNTVTEGPLVFLDNKSNLVHLFLDAYTTAGGYVPFQATSIDSGSWTASGTLPAKLKHGVVKPVNQAQYNAIQSKWP